MTRLPRGWSLGAKLTVAHLAGAALVVGASATAIYATARAELEAQAGALLGAAADNTVERVDAFNQRYLASAQRFARIPVASRACAGDAAALHEMQGILDAAWDSDADVFAAALLDPSGVVVAVTKAGTKGASVAHRTYFRRARAGESLVSDPFLVPESVGGAPVIAYVAPVESPAGDCAVALYPRAEALWELVRDQNGAVAEGSFASVLDADGVRIAHGVRQDLVFVPTGPLDPARVEALVADARFGSDTRERLEKVVPTPERAERASAASPDPTPFRHLAPVGKVWTLAVGRRATTAPWTVFVDVPEASIYAPVQELVGAVVRASLGLMVLSAVVSFALARRLVSPVKTLSDAADAIARGEPGRRVDVRTRDEIGHLGVRFNEMADAVEAARTELEDRVRARTRELELANEELRSQREELLAQGEELRAQQAELLRKNGEVREADRLKSQFLANMSHELRTPLNAVIGFSDLLLDDGNEPLSSRQARFVRDIHTSGRHLLELINDILDLSKIEAGKTTLSLADLEPARAIAEACAVITPAARRRGITVHEAPAPGVSVRGDPSRLRQILLNLLSNAVKFSPEGGDVHVGADLAGDHVRFWVRDAGPGIAPELRPHLFTPFVQGESPMVKRFEGTGLGLAICRRLVEMLGGEIGVESEPGRGATFHFTLPVATGAPATIVESSPPPPGAERPAPVISGDVLGSLGYRVVREATRDLAATVRRLASTRERARIVVVDDDPRVAEILRAVLEPAGYALTVAATAAEGLAAVRSSRPDLVLVDLALPDASGFDVVDALAGDPAQRDLPLFVLTAADLTDDLRARLRDRARAVARKGDLTGGELLAAVDRALARPVAPGDDAPVVLVVDDHDMNRTLAQNILEAAGYRVRVATDGTEGLAAARADLPDAILLDLAMPGLDGFAVTRALRADPGTARVPIVALTALAMRGDEERALEAGVEAFLTKPVDRPILLETLTRFTRRRAP